MSDQTPQFIPVKKPDAGTQIGVHYVAEFIKCPRKWFRRYYQPLPDETTGELINVGIEPRDTAPALLTGGIFHTALEEYYRSGIVDGEDTGKYDLDRTLAAMETSCAARKDSYYSEEDADAEREMIQTMLIAYWERFGPTSSNPDYPKIKVLCDTEGLPYIEREWITPLPYSNYYITSKIDLIITDGGYVKAMEHKTSVASFVTSRLSSIHYDAQFTAEIYTLTNNMPEATKFFGVTCNVVTKNRSAKSKYDIAERDTTNRTQDQLLDWANTTIDTLRQIDERVGQYEKWLTQGVEEDKALSVWFPVHGQFNEQCFAYRRPCDYYALCKQPERANSLLAVYKPRTKPEAESKTEE